MLFEKTYHPSLIEVITQKITDYIQLVKLRLSLLVIFSCAMGYLLAADVFSWSTFICLMAGGLLITWSSNTFNQVFEKDIDAQMKRTQNRPLPQNRMSISEALLAAAIMGAAGLMLLWNYTNPLCTYLAAAALLIYAFVYTPLKGISSIAVFVGAIPGALPILLGWIAARGTIGYEALLFFSIQFIWQFPHTWAIAWLMHEDYKKVGYKMLPSSQGQDKRTGFYTAFYTALLIPIALLSALFGGVSLVGALVLMIVGIFFFVKTIVLYRQCSNNAAKQVMFASFVYLPVALIALVLDKVFI